MISNNQITASCLGILALVGLSGCAGYKAQPLQRLATGVSPQEKKQSISFAHHVFSKGDCKYYLDRDVIAKGYQPIHITFTNNSSRTLIMSLESFSLPCVTVEEVAEKVHTNTANRVIGYGVSGLFFWPFLIAAAVDGTGSIKANEQLDADFGYKSIQDRIISPFSTINGLIFVPIRSFTSEFSLTVVDQRTNERFVLTHTTPRLNF